MFYNLNNVISFFPEYYEFYKLLLVSTVVLVRLQLSNKITKKKKMEYDIIVEKMRRV